MDKQTDIFSVKEYKESFVKNPKKKNQKKEESLQIAVCKYIKKQYPNVIFMCDLASGMPLRPWIGKRHKLMRSSRGLPDLFVACPGGIRDIGGGAFKFNGLFIELKGEWIRLKNKGIAQTAHTREQEAVLKKLRAQGYKAEFACGFDEARSIIDDYLSTM